MYLFVREWSDTGFMISWFCDQILQTHVHNLANTNTLCGILAT